MRNYKTIMDSARNLAGEGKAFLCGQYDNSQAEIMLSGDPECLIKILQGAITRMSQITNCSYREILGALKDLGSGRSQVITEGEVITQREPRADENRFVEIISQYEEENKNLMNKIVSAETALRILREQKDAELRQKDTTIKALNKELKDIEHRIDEIVEVRVKAYGVQ